MDTQTLDSEKYWQQSVKQELKDVNRQRDREAIGLFSKFVFALFLIFMVGQCSEFFPAIVDWADFGIDRFVQTLQSAIR